MTIEIQEDYKNELYRSLEKCQFIEDTLKEFLLSAVEIARIQASPNFPLKYKAEEISKLPLGQLVNAFSKINNDSSLLSELREITTERNHIAHRSLLFTIGEMGDSVHMVEATLKLKEIAQRASEIHGRVLDARYEILRKLSKVRHEKSKVCLK